MAEQKCSAIWINEPTTPFLDDFIKREQLGAAGQYGVTYQCQRKCDGKTFAVKYINKNRFYQIPKKNRHLYLKMMRDEIDILKTLDHEYIIKLQCVYEDETTLYIVMEECKGGELFERIRTKKRFSEKAAANIIKQILSALQYMHEEKGIVHCDLKPNNILFLTENEDSPIKIIDFGMSKILPRLQYLTNVCGTPYYTAPEIITNRKYNHSCDLWSVGVILYVMIYGYIPFYVAAQRDGKGERDAIYRKIAKGFDPTIKDASIYGYGPWFPAHIKTSEEVRDLISKLLQTKVRKRYTTNEALTHPWIVNKAYNDDTALNKRIISRLIRFNNASPFKLMIAKIFRNQFYKMRPERYHQLEQLFIKYDTSNNGVLSFEEFQRGIRWIDGINIEERNLEQIYYQLFNYNHPMGIQFSDLLNALVYDYLVSCDERLYDAFKKLDDNDDGKITTKELKQKLKQIDPLRDWDKAIKLIEQQSLRQNGVIDYETFLLNLHPNFDKTLLCIPDLFKRKYDEKGANDSNMNKKILPELIDDDTCNNTNSLSASSIIHQNIRTISNTPIITTDLYPVF